MSIFESDQELHNRTLYEESHEEETDADRLRSWHKSAARAGSIEEFRKKAGI